MADCKDFNVETYRQPWESDEHWVMRRDFLCAHSDKLPLNRLLCLAQVFVNIELLGCRYPIPVMRQVAELSKEINSAKELKDKRQERTQIHFVMADEAKRTQPVKGDKRKYSSVMQTSDQNKTRKTLGKYNSSFLPLGSSGTTNSLFGCNFVEHSSKKDKNVSGECGCNTSDSSNVMIVECVNSADRSLSQDKTDLKNGNLSRHKVEKRQSYFSAAPYSKSNNKSPVPGPTPLEQTFYQLAALVKNQVAHQPNALQAIQVSVSKLHLNYVWVFDEVAGQNQGNPKYLCCLYIENVLVGKGEGKNKKLAKSQAYDNAVEKLQNPRLQVLSTGNKGEEKLKLLASSFSPSSSGQSFVYSSDLRICQSGGINNMPKQSSQHPGTCLDDFIVIDDLDVNRNANEITVLMNTASFNRINIAFKFSAAQDTVENCIRCVLKLEEQHVGEGYGESKQTAKRAAAKDALQNLRNISYTVKVKQLVADGGQIISKEEVGEGVTSSVTDNLEVIPDSNIGFKLLQMMGWKGGGVGKEGNKGIVEPVNVKDVYKREGLGYSGERQITKEFNSKIKEILTNYKTSASFFDLPFSPEFNKEERKEIHRIADKLNLKSISRGGQGSGRYLVISHRFNPQQLLQHLLELGGSTDKYELIPPAKN
ncbi:uncharacterized protein LOC143225258 isoform X2 [Tachypleus tridentatus]